MTVTAQLMMGHEMALPLIMIERMLERQTEREGGRRRERERERGNRSDPDRMFGGSWRGEGGGGGGGNKSRYC